MIKSLIFFFILFNFFLANASPNIDIVKNFKKINSLKFNFVQKIDNNNIEKGECIILYTKKIFCKYDDFLNKILVSNGKFDKKNLDLIGLETRDIYQNIMQTFISDIKKNIAVDNKIFVIQKYIN